MEVESPNKLVEDLGLKDDMDVTESKPGDLNFTCEMSDSAEVPVARAEWKFHVT